VLFAFTVRARAYDSACGHRGPKLPRLGTPVWFATRAFGIAHIRNALQAASVLERTTFDEGSAWLPQRL